MMEAFSRAVAKIPAPMQAALAPVPDHRRSTESQHVITIFKESGGGQLFCSTSRNGYSREGPRGRASALAAVFMAVLQAARLYAGACCGAQSALMVRQ